MWNLQGIPMTKHSHIILIASWNQSILSCRQSGWLAIQALDWGHVGILGLSVDLELIDWVRKDNDTQLVYVVRFPSTVMSFSILLTLSPPPPLLAFHLLPLPSSFSLPSTSTSSSASFSLLFSVPHSSSPPPPLPQQERCS